MRIPDVITESVYLSIALRSQVVSSIAREYVKFLHSAVMTRCHEFVDINSPIQITYIGIV